MSKTWEYLPQIIKDYYSIETKAKIKSFAVDVGIVDIVFLNGKHQWFYSRNTDEWTIAPQHLVNRAIWSSLSMKDRIQTVLDQIIKGSSLLWEDKESNYLYSIQTPIEDVVECIIVLIERENPNVFQWFKSYPMNSLASGAIEAAMNIEIGLPRGGDMHRIRSWLESLKQI